MGLGRRPSFLVMMSLTTGFFLVELIVGYLTNSMALVADSFHMLSDIISLAVGYFALRFSQRKDTDVAKTGNTYGYVRAGVLGALINAVFLIALCLSIFISAIKRFVSVEPLNRPILILCVGSLGLVVNILGMFLFHGHAHSHGCGHEHSHGGGGGGHGHKEHGHSHKNGSHGHSHKSHGHTHGAVDQVKQRQDVVSMENGYCSPHNNKRIEGKPRTHLTAPHLNNYQCPPDSPSLRRFQERARDVETLFVPLDSSQINAPTVKTNNIEEESGDGDDKSGGHLNMKGVYLHLLGDALGSIIVIICALIIHFVGHHRWTMYIDPALSVFMTCIILNSSIPLLKESSMILLQNVPPHIQVKQLEHRLLESFPEIISVHEFHVWQLAGNKIIASVHVKFPTRADYNRISSNMKEFFHCEGIHSTTFQPEFQEGKGKEGEGLNQCLLSCVSKSCQEKVCCLPNSENKDTTTDNNESNEQVSGKVNGHISTTTGTANKIEFVTIMTCDTNCETSFEGDINCNSNDEICTEAIENCPDKKVTCQNIDDSCPDHSETYTSNASIDNGTCPENNANQDDDECVNCQNNVGFIMEENSPKV